MHEPRSLRPAVYKHYLLIVLTVILLFNYVDRVALGIVLQDIKVDLQLTDTQLGLLSGIAFALFYSVMGIPIARWADRGNRVTIISLTVVLWTAAVALCGMAGSFVQLLLIRVGVAVGEAGCIPPAFSLMADYFTRAERPRATAIYAMGGALSFVFGFFGAGWLNQIYGWRVTFILLALPGLVLAPLAWFTLREPRQITLREEFARPIRPGTLGLLAAQPSLKEVCKALWGNVTFRNLLLCLSVMYFFGYGIVQWQPTFFVRTYGLSTGQIGTWLAVTFGLGGLVGTYIGGEWACRFAANNERMQLVAMAIALIVSGITAIFVYLSPNPYCAFGLLGLYVFAQYTVYGPLNATIQTLVPREMRAVAVALMYLVANLIGMGLGPLAAGALSDALRPFVGEESLRYALLILSPGYLWGAWHAWRASRSVTRDLAAVELHADDAVWQVAPRQSCQPS
jgi:MFS family permease